MHKRVVQLPRDGEVLFEILSRGRAGPQPRVRFSPSEIQVIARTIRRTPEVMLKVTGGGGRPGAVAAHLSYISRKGELEIETDRGERLNKDAQKEFLDSWHLELTSGQYRRPRKGSSAVRKVKLVHNIVLSMPAPTPPEKVLAAARKFALNNFALQHRYVMVLHTDQRHPHVHLVVKAENEQGRRLHIDKSLLREWREDFARMMRDQGIAANATPRALRGRNKTRNADGIFRATRRGAAYALRERVTAVVEELARTGTIRDPARSKLVESRKAIVANWMRAADVLDAQGEVVLAGDVRNFASGLPPGMTDKERLAFEFLRHRKKAGRSGERATDTPPRDRGDEFTR